MANVDTFFLIYDPFLGSVDILPLVISWFWSVDHPLPRCVVMSMCVVQIFSYYDITTWQVFFAPHNRDWLLPSTRFSHEFQFHACVILSFAC